MTPAERDLFDLIIDLVTVLIPDPAVPASMCSQALFRLRKARESGWDGFNAAASPLGRSPEPVWTPRGYVGPADASAPSTAPPRPSVQARPYVRGTGVGVTGVGLGLVTGADHGEYLPGDGDFIPSIRIPERY